MAFAAILFRVLLQAAMAAPAVAISMSGGRIGSTRYGSKSPVANFTDRSNNHAGARIAARPGKQPANLAWQDAAVSAAQAQLALVQLAAVRRNRSTKDTVRFDQELLPVPIEASLFPHRANTAINVTEAMLIEGNYLLACAAAEREQLQRLMQARPDHPLQMWRASSGGLLVSRLMGELHGEAGSVPATLVKKMEQLCDYDTLISWGERQHAQGVFQSWQAARPRGLVYSVDRDDGCLVRGLTGVGPDSPFEAEPQVLSLVHHSGALICNPMLETFQTFSPEQFQVHKALWARGRHRNFGVVWPPNKNCTVTNPCPVVFSLSGIGEHSHGGNESMMNASYRTIAKFGFLRYAERDPHCFAELGSVLVFVQLDSGENWMRNGPELLEHFVVPLWEKLSAEREGLDRERVSIVGYSEGAFGALQAAAQHPDIFSLVVGASASTSEMWWRDAPIPHVKRHHLWRQANSSELDNNPDFRLKLVMVGLGEHDRTGAQDKNVMHVINWLDTYGVTDQASLEVRYYSGLFHKDVWDRLFNRWQRFHALFWKGDYSQLHDIGH